MRDDLCPQERDIVLTRYYTGPWWRVALFWVSGLLTLSLAWLACLWSLDFRMWLTLSETTVEDAQFVFIEVGVDRTLWKSK